MPTLQADYFAAYRSLTLTRDTEGATFHDVPHFAGGIVPGDGIFTTWSYRAGPARAEAFLLNPLAARTAHAWGVVAEVVPNGTDCRSKERRWPTS